MGHLYTGLSGTKALARSMLEDWEVDHDAEENDNTSAVILIDDCVHYLKQ